MKSFYLGLTAAVVLLCAGCMVGPDYFKPSVPMTAAYKEDQGWKLARPSDTIPRGKWWEIFGDPQLNALEEQVSEANQNVKVAEARFSPGARVDRLCSRRLVSHGHGRSHRKLCARFDEQTLCNVGERGLHRRLSFDRRHILRDRLVGPDPPQCDRRPRRSASNRRRPGKRQTKHSGRAGIRLFRAAQRRRATTAA